MNYDSDEKIIKNALNSIQTPAYDIMLAVEKKIAKPKSTLFFKRAVAIPLAVCLCLMISVGVMAATIPGFNKLLSIVSSDIALLLRPVGITSEDNGIKMEVVAAMNDDEMAVIYLTMQDLTGDRIDETLDIYNYSLSGVNTFNCQVVNYDQITKTAILRMQANGGEKLNGKKASFRITSFLSAKQTFDAVEIPINLSDIAKTNASQTVPLDMNNIAGGGGDLYNQLKAEGIINILKTDQMVLALPQIDFMHISNIGYVDGHLHIQTKWVGDGIDDHGYFYFADTWGNKLDIYPTNIYFGTDESGNTKYGRNYVEYIFDVDKIKLNEAKLMGHLVTHGNYTTGNWKTTFKIQSVGEARQTDCNIKFDTWLANKISVSPMGITLVGRGEGNNSHEISVNANMTDGTVQKFESVMSSSNHEEVKFKFTSSLPLDVAKVKSVTIDGTTINFN